MKDTVAFVFETRGLPWEYVAEVFEAIGRHDLTEQGESPISVYSVRLPADSQQLPLLRDELRRREMTWGETVTRSYTKRELEHAQLVRVVLAISPKGFGGPAYGTQYDLRDACSLCGTGAKQISPLIVRASDLPAHGDVATTADGEFLVSRQLASELEAQAFSGVAVGQVQGVSGEGSLPFSQLIVSAEMPPMSNASAGVVRDDACSRCGRNGYFETGTHPLEIVYEDLDLKDLADVSHTHERFGNSTLADRFCDSRFASGLMIIKPKVYELLAARRIRALRFEPVRVT